MWNSNAGDEAFRGSRLGAALAEVGLRLPVRSFDSELVNYQAPKELARPPRVVTG
jgi:hypothetical protein